ncbi:MAG: terminase small subunit [Synergistaceae bacterium]|jgi:phage terminase small subunit|nr:terminase small subunit [Synergistaceae bacterium]
MTPKQERFVQEYMVDLNATQAAIRAGYSVKTARFIGQENLTKPYIQDAIHEARVKQSARTQITVDRVLQELAKIGFANMANYMRVGESGYPVLDFSKLTRDQAAALVEVTVDDYLDGRGEDAREVRRVKFKLADKRGALVDIGKHLGMFIDHTEITGKEGGAIEFKSDIDLSNYSEEELMFLAQIVNKGSTGADDKGETSGNGTNQRPPKRNQRRPRKQTQRTSKK